MYTVIHLFWHASAFNLSPSQPNDIFVTAKIRSAHKKRLD